MTQIEFFKLQAKNLFKDYKTKTSVLDKEMNVYYYEYNPKYFDIVGIFLEYDVDEDNFTLMSAQHLIATIAGFYKWNDLVKANDYELELAKLLFDNQHKVSADDWHMYLNMTQGDNNVIFDSETRLEIFTMVFVNEDGHEPLFQDYRL